MLHMMMEPIDGRIDCIISPGESYRLQNWNYSPLKGATGYDEVIKRLMAPSFDKGFLLRITLL